MAIERERKFLVFDPEGVIQDVPADKIVTITQMYLSFDPEIRIRISIPADNTDSTRELTHKVKFPGENAARTEINIPLTHDQFIGLGAAGKAMIEKHRFTLEPYICGTDYGNFVVTPVVDKYLGEYEGLYVAEFEFSNADDLENFVPPTWCGAEITNNKLFGNATLAMAVSKRMHVKVLPVEMK